MTGLDKYKLSRSMNTIEAVANGCAIHAHQFMSAQSDFKYEIMDYNQNTVLYDI